MELHALYEVFVERLAHQIRKMPTRENPMSELDLDLIDGTV